MTTKTGGIVIRSPFDLLDPLDPDTERRLVVEMTTQYRGNRVTSRFYPDQYAKVMYARWLTQQYGGTHERQG